MHAMYIVSRIRCMPHLGYRMIKRHVSSPNMRDSEPPAPCPVPRKPKEIVEEEKEPPSTPVPREPKEHVEEEERKNGFFFFE
jgi:hypothetical protein